MPIPSSTPNSQQSPGLFLEATEVAPLPQSCTSLSRGDVKQKWLVFFQKSIASRSLLRLRFAYDGAQTVTGSQPHLEGQGAQRSLLSWAQRLPALPCPRVGV